MSQHWLSPSGLSDFKSCPRCFYFAKSRKIAYRGIFPGLPGGMDRILKDYFDKLRDDKKHVFAFDYTMRLFRDQEKLDEWRAYPKGGLVDETPERRFFGYIDDLLVTGKGKSPIAVPFDFKTKGDPPGPGYGDKYYKLQLSSYAYLLNKLGYKTPDYGYLAFVSPISGLKHGEDDRTIEFLFDITWQKVYTDVVMVDQTIKAAVKCLNGKMPDSGPGCEMCAYVNARGGREI